MCVCPTIAASNHDASKASDCRDPNSSSLPLPTSRENTKTDSNIPTLAPANLPFSIPITANQPHQLP